MNWERELTKGAGALAAGAGLGYFKALREKQSSQTETEKWIPLLADVGVAVVGIFGSMQASGAVAEAAAGVAGGALGMVGAELYKRLTEVSAPPSEGGGYRVPSFGAPVSFPTFATGASVIEI